MRNSKMASEDPSTQMNKLSTKHQILYLWRETHRVLTWLCEPSSHSGSVLLYWRVHLVNQPPVLPVNNSHLIQFTSWSIHLARLSFKMLEDKDDGQGLDLSSGFMSHPTQNRSLWRRSSRPVLHITKEIKRLTEHSSKATPPRFGTPIGGNTDGISPRCLASGN